MGTVNAANYSIEYAHGTTSVLGLHPYVECPGPDLALVRGTLGDDVLTASLRLDVMHGDKTLRFGGQSGANVVEVALAYSPPSPPTVPPPSIPPLPEGLFFSCPIGKDYVKNRHFETHASAGSKGVDDCWFERLPANLQLTSKLKIEARVSGGNCGGEHAFTFNPSTTIFNFFQKGTQGGWTPISSPTTVTGSPAGKYDQIWTGGGASTHSGSGLNHGFIFGACTGGFASFYDDAGCGSSTKADYCMGKTLAGKGEERLQLTYSID